MPVISPKDPTVAVSDLIGSIPGLEVSHGRAWDGSDWITIAWPASEFAIQQDATGTWSVFDPQFSAPISTGPTAPEAFRAALEHG